MKYRDLRDFAAGLEAQGELQRITQPVSVHLEMTALSDRVLRAGRPALSFEQAVGAPHPQTGGSPHVYGIPVLTNLFGTPKRVAMGMGADDIGELRDIGTMLSHLKEPEPPRGLKDAGKLLHMAKALWDMKPKQVSKAPCQEVVLEGNEVDLTCLPVQLCWPEDAAPLLTWGLVVTRGPQGVPRARHRQNLGIYRQQLIGSRQVIMRWLAHRGGALDFREFAQINPGQPFPIAVAFGADPATILGAVT